MGVMVVPLAAAATVTEKAVLIISVTAIIMYERTATEIFKLLNITRPYS